MIRDQSGGVEPPERRYRRTGPRIGKWIVKFELTGSVDGDDAEGVGEEVGTGSGLPCPLALKCLQVATSNDRPTNLELRLRWKP